MAALARLGLLLCCMATLLVQGCTSTSITTGPSPEKCGVSLTASSTTLPPSGGMATVAVNTERECTWTVSTDASWISGVTPTSGQGSGEVQAQIMPNPQPTARQGSITVNGEQLQVRQEAATCTFTVAPLAHAFTAAPTESPLTVTPSVTPCAWTAVSGVPWITITGGVSGTGPATVTFVVAANTGAARTGELTVAGQTVAIVQGGVGSGGSCSVEINPTSQTAPAAGGAGTVITVSTTAGCTWTANSQAPWLTITSGAIGTGNGTVAFTIAPNTGPSRTGSLTVAGQTFSVTQGGGSPGPSCSYAINPTAQSVPASAGAGTAVSVTAPAGCTWTAVSNATWITVTSGAIGSGNGSVGFTVAANTGPSRVGTITIAGQTFTVTQAASGPSCTFVINPSSASMGASGGAGTPISVTTATGCAWTATSNASWLTITSGPGGSGNGTVTFTAAANTGAERSGTLTIAGQTFTVTQAPGNCSYAINPTSRSIGENGGTGTIEVTTTAGCTWTAVSNANWITITAGGSGTGSGTVVYSISRNNSNNARTGTITVAGRTFTVTQDED